MGAGRDNSRQLSSRCALQNRLKFRLLSVTREGGVKKVKKIPCNALRKDEPLLKRADFQNSRSSDERLKRRVDVFGRIAAAVAGVDVGAHADTKLREELPDRRRQAAHSVLALDAHVPTVQYQTDLRRATGRVCMPTADILRKLMRPEHPT